MEKGKENSVGSVFTVGLRLHVGMVAQKRRHIALCGSTVIEAAYLFPVIMAVWMLVLFSLFYYHDKNILAGAAYEAVVVGSELAHNKEPSVEGKTKEYFEARIRGKLIFFPGASVSVNVEKERLIVSVSAHAKWMTADIRKSAALTEPEKVIRKFRIGKQGLEDLLE